MFRGKVSGGEKGGSVKKQKVEAYEDIPGTWVFDAQRARIGYRVNEFLYSLMKAANRAEFLADERRYLMKFGMTEEQLEAVMKRNWNKLLELGAVSYALAKLAFTDGKTYQFMASQMTGMTEKEYVDMMVAGGRSPDGWRSKSERGEK
jgi:protocatechuate 4,5-dioxygenase alpha chain